MVLREAGRKVKVERAPAGGEQGGDESQKASSGVRGASDKDRLVVCTSQRLGFCTFLFFLLVKTGLF